MAYHCREGFYGVYRVTSGVDEGAIVYYDDDTVENKNIRAVCYFQGTNAFKRIPYQFLAPATPTERKAFSSSATPFLRQLMRQVG